VNGGEDGALTGGTIFGGGGGGAAVAAGAGGDTKAKCQKAKGKGVNAKSGRKKKHRVQQDYLGSL
jgi:hypothetical protein